MRTSISLNNILVFINSLSLSAGHKQWLGERLLDEAQRERTKETDNTDKMLNKHFGVWSDDRSTNEIVSDIYAERHSNKLPLFFD